MSEPTQPEQEGPVTMLHTPVRLDYTAVAGHHLSLYLRGFSEKKILGAHCGGCNKVLVPPRGACPTCGIPTGDTIQVKDVGTLTTFCIISIPFGKMPFPPPYVAGAILLDGADLPIFHLIRGIKPEDVRMGMRLKAIWKPDEELGPTLESIQWFEPTGEPDADYATYKEHL